MCGSAPPWQLCSRSEWPKFCSVFLCGPCSLSRDTHTPLSHREKSLCSLTNNPSPSRMYRTTVHVQRVCVGSSVSPKESSSADRLRSHSLALSFSVSSPLPFYSHSISYFLNLCFSFSLSRHVHTFTAQGRVPRHARRAKRNNPCRSCMLTAQRRRSVLMPKTLQSNCTAP